MCRLSQPQDILIGLKGTEKLSSANIRSGDVLVAQVRPENDRTPTVTTFAEWKMNQCTGAGNRTTSHLLVAQDSLSLRVTARYLPDRWHRTPFRCTSLPVICRTGG